MAARIALGLLLGALIGFGYHLLMKAIGSQ